MIEGGVHLPPGPRPKGGSLVRFQGRCPDGGKSAHVPVLLEEVLEQLGGAMKSPENADRDRFIDFTFGLGGHSFAALSRFENLKVSATEADPYAIELAKNAASGFVEAGRLAIYNGNFADFDSAIPARETATAFAALADLGVSSYQIEAGGRGFSFDDDESFDMRMNPLSGGESAADVVNSLGEEELADIFYSYGDERLSRKIAAEIVRRRKTAAIRSCREFAEIVRTVYHRFPSIKMGIDFATRAVMALRIYVNLELENLGTMLEKTLSRFEPGTRVMIISFHSKEDLAVKEFIRKNSSPCVCPPRSPVCVCGARPRLRPVTRKPVVPREEEKSGNPRSRSAKMRIYEVI